MTADEGRIYPFPYQADWRGMTLRDYFAAMAMNLRYGSRGATMAFEDIAKSAYSLADTMLAARGGVVLRKDKQWSYETRNIVYNALNFYANVTSYQGERTGGILQGCPRAPDPTPDELVQDARTALRHIERELGGESLPCGHLRALMHKSAETGEPLYCEACDDKSARHDAEKMEAELRAAVTDRDAKLALVYKCLSELGQRIERCGASVELTRASALCCDMALALSRPGDKSAQERVTRELALATLPNGSAK